MLNSNTQALDFEFQNAIVAKAKLKLMAYILLEKKLLECLQNEKRHIIKINIKIKILTNSAQDISFHYRVGHNQDAIEFSPRLKIASCDIVEK